MSLHPSNPGIVVKLRIAVQKDAFLMTGFCRYSYPCIAVSGSSKYELISKKEVEWLGRKYKDIIQGKYVIYLLLSRIVNPIFNCIVKKESLSFGSPLS